MTTPRIPGQHLAIGIIGAGSAGLASAIAFAQAGHKVVVFEKHPSITPLGAGILIQPQGVRALEQLGVGRAFSEASVPIDQLLGICHRGWRLVDVPYGQTEARAVSRAALSEVLYGAARQAGVDLRFGARVASVGQLGEMGLVQLDSGRALFDLVVIADGAGSALAEPAGLTVASSIYPWAALWGMFDVDAWAGERILEQRYHTTRKMYGLMPTARIGNKLRLSLFWSLPRDQYASWQKSSLEDWKQELLTLWPASAPVVDQIERHDQFALATYRHAHAKSLAKPPLCLVGDAAHAMSPQLGLGTTLAVQDALMLAQAVAALGPVAGPLAYSKRRLRAVRSYQMLSKLLTPCFQADGVGLWRDIGFAVGQRLPGMRQVMRRSLT